MTVLLAPGSIQAVHRKDRLQDIGLRSQAGGNPLVARRMESQLRQRGGETWQDLTHGCQAVALEQVPAGGQAGSTLGEKLLGERLAAPVGAPPGEEHRRQCCDSYQGLAARELQRLLRGRGLKGLINHSKLLVDQRLYLFAVECMTAPGADPVDDLSQPDAEPDGRVARLNLTPDEGDRQERHAGERASRGRRRRKGRRRCRPQGWYWHRGNEAELIGRHLKDRAELFPIVGSWSPFPPFPACNVFGGDSDTRKALLQLAHQALTGPAAQLACPSE